MKTLITYLRIMVFLPFIFICSSQTINAQGGNGGGGNGGGGGGNGGGGHNGGGGDDGETAGNNLSFPVIFADGGSKVLPGTMGVHSLEGVWWYVWGEDPIDPQAPLYSCEPQANNSSKCKDGTTPGDGISTLYKAYVQKDPKNLWQAYNAHVTPGETLNVDWVDWGDNLESLAWKINSRVRTEVVLYEDIDSVTQYSMRHVDSWGTDEVHGAQTTLEDEPLYATGTQATIFTPKARLTIQKLNFPKTSIDPSRLIWIAETGWTEANGENVNIINEPMLNQSISEAGSGPAFFNAEINVKGKIMFGYTWDVNSLNQGEGYYRITFSFDEGNEAIGTAKFDELTQIIVAEEEEETTEFAKVDETAEGGPGGGGVPIMDPSNNLTYIDVLIGQDGGEDLPWVAVTGLELIDAANDVSLGSLTDGMSINMNEVSFSNLSVEALTTKDVGSVKFELSGENSSSRTENDAPYTLYGHSNGDYSGNNFTTGNYNLTVTPYSEDNLTGEVGIPLTVSFEMVVAPPDNETAGNNLSFPVIFADGSSKVLPGTLGSYSLEGEWWYVWGEDPVDPQAPLYSCKPHGSNPNKCEDGKDPGDETSQLYKAYIQKDKDNVWQAYNASVPDNDTLYVNWVDWGDNLESLAWKINSKVRTEVVLLQDIDSVTQFGMRHVDSWGTDEVHGLQTTLDDEPVYGKGAQATVFTENARFTIQKLNFTSESIGPTRLTWLANEKRWTETNITHDTDIINEPIFNQAVSEAESGPAFFNAEINVKGKIMYGYSWDVSSMNQGEGHYRLTFSFDEGTEGIGTARFNESTKIIVPIEEETTKAVKTTKTLEAPGGGGIAVMNASNNLTYLDVLIGTAGPTLYTHKSDISTFKMYPNPITDGMLNIKGAKGNVVNIYNTIGQMVYTTKISDSFNVHTLNLSTLQTGVYFVKISDGTNATVKKLILK